jgi:hypothetical protein
MALWDFAPCLGLQKWTTATVTVDPGQAALLLMNRKAITPSSPTTSSHRVSLTVDQDRVEGAING